MGKVPHSSSPNNNSSMLVASMLSSQSDIESLWRLEVIGITDPVEVKTRYELEQSALKHFSETVKLNEEGRYEVHLPWLASNIKVGSNKNLAEKRLRCTTEKLMASGHLLGYGEVFQEWLQEGIIERVPIGELDAEAHYLPHRAVIKTASTTKIRPVYDASSHEKGLPSLNDCLEKGPNLIETIPAVLLRFREKKLGVISDIKKAFLQIAVAASDCNYMRFLWWDSDERQTVCVFRHVRVVFGVSCSPFLLGAVINHHLKLFGSDTPELAKKLKDSFYVDNCVTSVDSETEYVWFMEKSRELMSMGKFDLRDWECSGIAGENFESQVLGLLWDKEKDTLRIGKVDVNLSETAPVTKRKLLSIAHQLFDPLGFTRPVSLYPKLLLQEAWELKTGWDKELPPGLSDKFLRWAGELKLLESVQIPRWLTVETVSRGGWSVHTFCDASKLAYAAVVYIRVETSVGVSVQLALAKTRVAPVKKMTIPRLELLACLIGSRLTSSVIAALELNDVPVTYWSDSATALSWIRNEEEWNVFVGNRVKEIRSITDAAAWKHVPGILNPADLPSRGCTSNQLLESRWWEGPAWLKECSDYWPKEQAEVDEAAVSSERKKSVKFPVNTLISATSDNIKKWYSRSTNDFERCLRHVCVLLKYRDWIRDKTVVNPLISVLELKVAEQKLVKVIQTESFGKVQNNYVNGIAVFCDDEGVWRVQSKIERRNDTKNFKNPVILPADHELVFSLIRKRHELLSHAGAQTVLVNLRESFWIVRGRKTVNSVITKCIICRRFNASPLQTVPSALPLDRVREAGVFEVTGVDLAGPLFLKDGKKSWVVLYTCAVYRAVHLELVTSLSTEAFMQSLHRFIARRGRAAVVYSDSGTNFQGANNAFAALNWDTIAREAGIQRIQWKFSPPTAAWWGGFWERLIGVLKGILKKVLGRASLSYEELLTVLCDCEAVINSRPLTYVSEDPLDLSPLTPAMFLQDVREVGVPDLEAVDQRSLFRRVTHRQKVSADLKKRFRDEYLSQLIQRKKEKNLRAVQIGDLVLVGADNVKRINWPMGRVIELLPGSDHNVRVVKVKTAAGVLVRPVKRLYPLELSTVLAQEVNESTEGSDEAEAESNDVNLAENSASKVPCEEVEKILRQKIQQSKCGRSIKKPVRYM